MKYYQLITLALVAAIIFSCRHQDSTSQLVEPEDNEELSELSIYNLPSRWITQSNEEIVLADLRGEVLVVAMIYTTCQFACPRLVADMKAIEAGIAPEDLESVNIVLVSIDPERDQPDTLRLFAQKEKLDSAHWTLLHGHADDVLEFAAVLGVKYKKVTPVDFSHSNIISVFNREGELAYQQDGYGVENIDNTIARINHLIKKGE